MKIKSIVPPNLGWFEIKLDDVHIKHLWDCIKNPIKNNKSNLAGVVSDSQLITDKDDLFFNEVLVHICRRYEEEFNGFPSAIPTSDCHPLFLSSMWVNYQKQTEYNPRHNHTGIYSFVIWMKIPTKFEDQSKLKIAESNTNTISNFCFDYNDILGQEKGYIYTMSPRLEGTMLFFPSQLSHQVYPFYNCDDDRISISGNILLDSKIFLSN